QSIFMLFANRRVRPPRGPIELGDEGLSVVEPQLIDAVLITIQCEQPAIAAVVLRFDCVKNNFGGQSRIWLHRPQAYRFPTAAHHPCSNSAEPTELRQLQNILSGGDITIPYALFDCAM